MPPLETSDLAQYAVMWGQLDYDDNGRPTLDSAVEIRARYEIELGEVISNNDSSITQAIEVVVDREIPIGTQMRLGRLSEVSSPLDKLLQVVGSIAVPDLKGRYYRRTVTLMKKRS